MTPILHLRGRATVVAVIAMLPLFAASCGKPRIEEQNPIFLKAMKAKESNPQEAVKLFSEYLAMNPNSVKTNLELAGLHQEQGDAFKAVHYYNTYLAMARDGSDRNSVAALRDASEQSLYESLEAKYGGSKAALEAANTELNTLRPQIAMLTEKLKSVAKTEKPPDKPTADTTAPVKTARKSAEAKAASDGGVDTGRSLVESGKPSSTDTPLKNVKNRPTQSLDSYEVQPGDTLSKIAQKLLGDKKFSKDVFEANKDLLRTPSDIKTGQRLKIPKVGAGASAAKPDQPAQR